MVSARHSLVSQCELTLKYVFDGLLFIPVFGAGVVFEPHSLSACRAFHVSSDLRRMDL
jgi:hypothetical protein